MDEVSHSESGTDKKTVSNLACWTKDDERISGHFVDKMNEVDLFKLERDEEVILEKFVHGLILGGDLYFDWVVKWSPGKRNVKSGYYNIQKSSQ